MRKATLRLVSPATENRTVTPKRAKNSDLRSREYLTGYEVEGLMDAARRNRHGHRDTTMILIAFRHGLRASELVGLRWDQISFDQALLHVRRAKRGTPDRSRSRVTPSRSGWIRGRRTGSRRALHH
jgi:type 1 fimbriae regulatory protein FimB/type 1 fimbriae regulatory protein FimE